MSKAIRKFTLTFILVMFLPPVADSSDVTTGSFVDMCKAKQDYCYGYMHGFVSGVVLLNYEIPISFPDETTQGPRVDFCLPDNWSVKQGVAVFLKWAEANPDKWHERLRVNLLLALVDSFRCQ
ncbi:MAG: Rap1a/Tai family immunity protein [Gammaproteobacteria bacterium]|nr:Rap1a/Tai family immunity protein [Gammaproteobacteria bacterium]